MDAESRSRTRMRQSGAADLPSTTNLQIVACIRRGSRRPLISLHVASCVTNSRGIPAMIVTSYRLDGRASSTRRHEIAIPGAYRAYRPVRSSQDSHAHARASPSDYSDSPCDPVEFWHRAPRLSRYCSRYPSESSDASKRFRGTREAPCEFPERCLASANY